MAHDEDQGWNEEEITLSEIAELNARKKELKEGYRGYVARNRDIKDILNGFMTSALLEKPENVFEFARKASSKLPISENITAAAPNLIDMQHFAGVQAEYAPQDAGTLMPLVITGTPGVGKKTIVAKLKRCVAYVCCVRNLMII